MDFDFTTNQKILQLVGYIDNFIGGILSISELAGDADKMTLESLKALAVASRFELSQQFESKGSYTVNFIKQ